MQKYRVGKRLLPLTAAVLFLLAGTAAGPLSADEADPDPRGPVEPVAPQPFANGDVFIGATYLDNADDDHAGRGRVLQYDADLNLKRVIWLEGTTHLISGLTFDADDTLWGFDIWAWQTLRVASDGRQLANLQFAQRPLSLVQFLDDNSLLLSEAMSGDSQPMSLSTRHPALPGEESKFGDGDIYRFDRNGVQLEVQDPEIDGGVTGSFAINHAVLSADRESLIYVSETGPRLMRYDFVNGKQLPDIPRNTNLQPQMHFALTSLSGGRLLISMGNRLDLISEDGDEIRVYPLEGFGWSVLAVSPDEHFVYTGNWFNGQFSKVDLRDGEVKAQTNVCPRCMASVAVFRKSQE